MERRVRDGTKVAQRAVLTAVSSEGGGLVVLLLCSGSCLVILLLVQGLRLTLWPAAPCASCGYGIYPDASPPVAFRDFRSADEAIDVVYTWVNGSDGAQREALEAYRPTSAAVSLDDSGNGANRYRDNEELRYSLRSL